jgi:hypothetical protein
LKHLLFITALFLTIAGQSQTALNINPTYGQLINKWKELARKHPRQSKMVEAGLTDSGLPLHTFIIDKSGKFDAISAHKADKIVILILNGIHAGEPDGMVASLAFAERVAANPPQDVVYCIIPVYNIGGVLNRNTTSRVNQNGPEEYGFRGNAINIDLNRDFIKCDSKNAQSFVSIFQQWKPHILIDTHTSNGADYQHTMTLVHTFPEKLSKLQASLLQRDMLPYLYDRMKKLNEPMTPYVNTVGPTPESGLAAFTDLPRYSTGYAALFNTIGFMTETHMLKPFESRVSATLKFLHIMDTLAIEKKGLIVQLKKQADKETAESKSYTTKWKLGSSAETTTFSGYRADTLISAVTGLKRIKYNQNKPYTEEIPYYNQHEGIGESNLPQAYIVPRAWTNVIDRLRLNGIEYRILEKDTMIQVESVYIIDFKTTETPYEGHYLHSETKTSSRKQQLQFRKGDIYIPTNQIGNRYLAHVFDAASDDSFFNWNFFDSQLSQKEYFSDYIFEDVADSLLKSNTSLKRAFEEKKRADKTFAEDSRAQLDFIYKNSPYYEESHNRLPVYKVTN